MAGKDVQFIFPKSSLYKEFQMPQQKRLVPAPVAAMFEVKLFEYVSCRAQDADVPVTKRVVSLDSKSNFSIHWSKSKTFQFQVLPALLAAFRKLETISSFTVPVPFGITVRGNIRPMNSVQLFGSLLVIVPAHSSQSNVFPQILSNLRL